LLGAATFSAGLLLALTTGGPGCLGRGVAGIRSCARCRPDSLRRCVRLAFGAINRSAIGIVGYVTVIGIVNVVTFVVDISTRVLTTRFAAAATTTRSTATLTRWPDGGFAVCVARRVRCRPAWLGITCLAISCIVRWNG
jgi:hypothetical protein